MGRIFTVTLEGPHLCCRCCRSALAAEADLLSRAFHSKHGPAWLFQSVVNVLPGPAEERLMTTGIHTVADIACVKCSAQVGWVYIGAQEPSQRYKEGKYILERVHVVEGGGNDTSRDMASAALLLGLPRGETTVLPPVMSLGMGVAGRGAERSTTTPAAHHVVTVLAAGMRSRGTYTDGGGSSDDIDADAVYF